MCGIFSVLREPGTRKPPTQEEIDAFLDQASKAAESANDAVVSLAESARHLTDLNVLLKGSAGASALLATPELEHRVESRVAEIDQRVIEVEADLDAGHIAPELVEDLNHSLTLLKDATWAIRKDRLRTVEAIASLCGSRDLPAHVVESYFSIQLALSALDRLEVRGRDSAGISVVISAEGLVDDEIAEQVIERQHHLFLSTAVDRSGDTLIFVYKSAAEIGALGDNVRFLHSAIAKDEFLKKVLARPNAVASVVAHTRWASVGTVSESNAHPIDSRETNTDDLPCVVACLNGDIDNYNELKARWHLQVADEITTDTKVIPVMVSRRMLQGENVVDAFKTTVSEFVGSCAISLAAADDPDRLLFAVCGSGQGCYVGFAEDSFLVASEPYGLVEECSTYLRLDGETPSAVSGKNGQIVELRRQGAGTLAGISRYSYGGEEIPITEDQLSTAEITTRDVDRGGATHFLLKEISESPQSVHRTLRGKIVENKGRLSVSLANEAFPQAIRNALKAGKISQIEVIGQGTAAIAGRSLAAVLESIAPNAVAVKAGLATELSGFRLRDDMSDTLVIAVSQSGTTTDTNRTVDLVRTRGASVIGIVNRRQSDLTERVDGVFYTSDGRDIEMSVASTKAFYAQVTAASVLAIAIADALDATDRQKCQELLKALRGLPEAMAKVLALRSDIAESAKKYAPSKRSWAIVGNGPNHIAAAELRIKLSELCYKSIAVDSTEDKKHVDLSSEPMILVCAAGLSGSTAADVAKEVAIYRAHKATAIVIASEGSEFNAAEVTIRVPKLHSIIDFVLSTMVGHLFGYEAALAIDAQSRLMRVARAALDDVIAAEHDEDQLLSQLRVTLYEPASDIFKELSSGALNGHLNTSTAVNVANLLRCATGIIPLESLELETGRPTSPSLMAAELLAALTMAIDELMRPIDAVKHQAKTVTVGISRTEDTFADNRLVQEAMKAGALRERLGYRAIRTLASLDAGVDQVIGFTRYVVEGETAEGNATIHVVDRGGIAVDIPSRADVDPRLTGTKHRAAYERMVTVGRGQRDGRSVIIVPESKDQQVVAITLLHTTFKSALDAEATKDVMTGYRNRYSALVDAVMETESDFDDNHLSTIPLLDLLVEPVWVLANKWRS